jgi:hypothetical protein
MKKLPSVEHVETLSLPAMRRLVADLVKLSHEHEAEFEKLRLINERLRLENEQLTLKHERLQLESDMLRFENQQLRDEIARLKNLPPRPPFKGCVAKFLWGYRWPSARHNYAVRAANCALSESAFVEAKMPCCLRIM